MEIIGISAATLTTLAFLPQALKAWSSKETDDISMLTYVVITAEVSLWLWYGVILQNWIMIVPNTLVLFMALFIIFLKIRYDT